ncbi:MAG: DUF1751 domain-containing protein, partial [Lysobacteraceae bacterium]
MFNHLPKATQALLWINGGIFLLQSLLDPNFAHLASFMLWPLGGDTPVLDPSGMSAGLSFMPWQLLTYGFLHENIGH